MRRAVTGVLATLLVTMSGLAAAQETPPPPPPLPPPAAQQPTYAAPQPTYAAPPPTDYRRAPRTLDWEPGEPVPEGYHVTTQIRTGLVVTGAVVFGSVWLLNALVASIGIDTNQGQALPLFIPVVGPFIAMGTFRSLQAVDTFFLALDGLVQAGGLAMLIVGIAAPRQRLTLNRYSSMPLLVPMSFGPGSAGIGISGSL